MSDTTPYAGHYAYPLVTWGSTLLGAVVALITSLMLNLLGAAVGVAAIAIGQSSGAAASAGIIGVVWVAVANLLALGFGAWVAGRSTANPDHHGGALQGIAVWAVTSFAVLFIAGSALAGLGGAVVQVASVGATASSGAIARQAGRPDLVAQARNAMREEPTPLRDDPAAVQDAAAKTAAATAAGAFGTVLAMLLGLAAAVVGARAGARHPNWSDRPRYTLVERQR